MHRPSSQHTPALKPTSGSMRSTMHERKLSWLAMLAQLRRRLPPLIEARMARSRRSLADRRRVFGHSGLDQRGRSPAKLSKHGEPRQLALMQHACLLLANSASRRWAVG
jgi:hypothetical protein